MVIILLYRKVLFFLIINIHIFFTSQHKRRLRYVKGCMQMYDNVETCKWSMKLELPSREISMVIPRKWKTI